MSELKNRFRKVESDNKIYPETPGAMNPTVRFEETSEIPAIDAQEIQVQEKSNTDYTYTENTVTTMSDFPSIPVTPYQESDDEYMANAVSGSATDNEEDRDKK